MQASFGTVANPEVIFDNGLTADQFCLQALSQSMIVTELEVESFVGRPVEFDDLVNQGKALHGSDIARFHCFDLEHPSMLWGSAEYFRWYHTDGKKRTEPLDYYELVTLVMFRDRCTLDEAEREVALHSRAKPGDKELWQLVISLGYLEWTEEFAQEEYGAL